MLSGNVVTRHANRAAGDRRAGSADSNGGVVLPAQPLTISFRSSMRSSTTSLHFSADTVR
jgi:hypothetical protein